MNDEWMVAGAIAWAGLATVTISLLLRDEFTRRCQARIAACWHPVIEEDADRRTIELAATLEHPQPKADETVYLPPAQAPRQGTPCLVCGRLLVGKRSVKRQLGARCARKIRTEKENPHEPDHPRLQ